MSRLWDGASAVSFLPLEFDRHAFSLEIGGVMGTRVVWFLPWRQEDIHPDDVPCVETATVRTRSGEMNLVAGVVNHKNIRPPPLARSTVPQPKRTWQTSRIFVSWMSGARLQLSHSTRTSMYQAPSLIEVLRRALRKPLSPNKPRLSVVTWMNALRSSQLTRNRGGALSIVRHGRAGLGVATPASA